MNEVFVSGVDPYGGPINSSRAHPSVKGLARDGDGSCASKIKRTMAWPKMAEKMLHN